MPRRDEYKCPRGEEKEPPPAQKETANGLDRLESRFKRGKRFGCRIDRRHQRNPGVISALLNIREIRRGAVGGEKMREGERGRGMHARLVYVNLEYL